MPKVIDPQVPPFTANQAAYLIILRPENREPEQIELLEYLVKQHPDLETLVGLANEFLGDFQIRKPHLSRSNQDIPFG